MKISMRYEQDGLYDLPYETVWLEENEFPAKVDEIESVIQEEQAICIITAQKKVLRVDICSNTMLRIRIGKEKIMESVTEKYGLITQPVEKVEWKFFRNSNEILVKTENVSFGYAFHNNEFVLTNSNGEILLKTKDGGVRFSEENAEYSGVKTLTRFERIKKEHYFGFGGRTMPPDRTGSSIDIFDVKVGLEAGDFGGCPVPYFISTNGYGLFLNNPWPHVYFDMGRTTADEWFVHTPGGEFDLFVFQGEDFGDITRQYTDITGRVPCCDKAVFGFWCSSIGFEEDKEVLENVERLHAEGYPCDVVVIDGPWRGGKAFLRDYTKAGAYPTNDIKWHPEFGDGPGMIQKLLEKNVKTSLHINSRCFLPETYIPAIEKGLLRAQGEEVVPDFKTQKAIEYYKDLLRPRIEEGLWVWWTDHADRVSGEIEDGIPSRNLFGALWNKVISETMAEMGHDNHISLSRGSGIGGQKYALPWPGDTKFGLDRFREDIWFCLNAGLAGFSVTSYDLGGFACTPTGAPYKLENDPAFEEENICRRVLQSIIFAPAPRIHNNQVSIPKFPWVCPPQTRDLYKAVLKYRYELIPYVYSTAINSSLKGEPIVRPLVYHHMKDEMTYCINDELYLGESILVAPVVNYGERQRLVYLPEGDWIDNWTLKEYKGNQWIMLECPLYELKGLPMLIKKGAIIPKQEFSLTLSEEVPQKLYLDIYPAESGKLVLYEGKDILNNFTYKMCGNYLELELENNTKLDRTYEVRIPATTAVVCIDVPRGSVCKERIRWR